MGRKMGMQREAAGKHITPFNKTDRIVISSQVKINVVDVIELKSDARVWHAFFLFLFILVSP